MSSASLGHISRWPTSLQTSFWPWAPTPMCTLCWLHFQSPALLQWPFVWCWTPSQASRHTALNTAYNWITKKHRIGFWTEPVKLDNRLHTPWCRIITSGGIVISKRRYTRIKEYESILASTGASQRHPVKQMIWLTDTYTSITTSASRIKPEWRR